MLNRNFLRLIVIKSLLLLTVIIFHSNTVFAQVVCDNFPIVTCNVPPSAPYPFTISDNNAIATGQLGEPSSWASPKSLWFSFTPTVTGTYYIKTTGTNPNNTLNVDTFLALYSGTNTSFANLNLVASNNDWGSPCTLFTATALGTEHPSSSCLIGFLFYGVKYYLKADSNLGGPGGNLLIDFGLLQAFTPTAANVSINGRVMDDYGRGVSRSIVTITDINGNSRTATTNPFGYYRFLEVESGQNYILTAKRKGYQFENNPRVINVNDNIDGENFVGSNPFVKRE